MFLHTLCNKYIFVTKTFKFANMWSDKKYMGRERDNSIEKLCTGDDWSGSKGVWGLRSPFKDRIEGQTTLRPLGIGFTTSRILQFGIQQWGSYEKKTVKIQLTRFADPLKVALKSLWRKLLKFWDESLLNLTMKSNPHTHKKEHVRNFAHIEERTRAL